MWSELVADKLAIAVSRVSTALTVPPVPNTALPQQLGTKLGTVTGWIQDFAILAILAAVVLSGAAMAWGAHSERAALHERGKRALIWSVVGAAVIASATAIVNGSLSL